MNKKTKRRNSKKNARNVNGYINDYKNNKFKQGRDRKNKSNK